MEESVQKGRQHGVGRKLRTSAWGDRNSRSRLLDDVICGINYIPCQSSTLDDTISTLQECPSFSAASFAASVRSYSIICLLQLIPISQVTVLTTKTYYLLGKNLPFSGIRVLSSSSALTPHATAVIPSTRTPKIAVLDFQFFGCAYHPPAGDQTCFGYLLGR